MVKLYRAPPSSYRGAYTCPAATGLGPSQHQASGLGPQRASDLVGEVAAERIHHRDYVGHQGLDELEQRPDELLALRLRGDAWLGLGLRLGLR